MVRSFARRQSRLHLGDVSREDTTHTAPAQWWQQVFDVLDRALELPEAERATFFARESQHDHAVAHAAAGILSEADAPTFLAAPAAEFAEPLLRDIPELETSTSSFEIGQYRIIREIGHGGMGTVYLAERADKQYEKRVAIKVLPRWSASNERLVRRFLDERQILAALDHPDIAHLLDGGVTTDGLPWFAMEFVDGLPIDIYCKHGGLSTEVRLMLFCRVCRAVQYAHRNLVVHRDLKPANIMVTADGGVKLLDFGIAKLLARDINDEAPSLTLTRDRMMTPLYASPEQLRGEKISTATDVYALGLLLNELLTGGYPYKLTTREPHEVARAILEQEPTRPSLVASPSLARHLQGDLDTIVLTAMQKDPSRRYGTAEQLEADVRRHLQRLPLAARPETHFSRGRKFVARHRVGVATAAGVIVLLLAFAVVSTVQSVRIRGQAARISVERDRAEQVSSFLAGLFRSSDPYAGGGAALTARQLLDSGAVRIDRELAAQPDARAQMMFEMGRAYFGLGSWPRARRFVETSLAIRRRGSSPRKVEIAGTLEFLGLVLREQGELDAAERAYREALQMRRELVGSRHREFARTLNGLASVLRAAGEFRDAESISREAVAIDETASTKNDLDRAESLDGLAQAVSERGNFLEAEQLYRRVVSLRRVALGSLHPEVARSSVRLAAAVGNNGHRALADSLFRDAIQLERRLLGDDHPDVAADKAEHARLLHSSGNDTEAVQLYESALATARRKLPPVHPLTASMLAGLSQLELDRGAFGRSEKLSREALAMRRAVLPPQHPHIAETEQLIGASIMALHRYAEAETFLLASHEKLRVAYGDSDTRTKIARRRILSLYEESRQPNEAARFSTRADATPISPLAQGRARPSDPVGGRGAKASGLVVRPFMVTTANPGVADLGRWAEDLLSARLSGNSSSEGLERFTGYMVSGEISGSSQQVALDATVTRGSGDFPGKHARVAGTADSLPQLADILASRLLASLASETGADSVALASTSLAALRTYLDGRSVYRGGRVEEAVAKLELAVSLDSTFALPSMWLAEISALRGNTNVGVDERWRYDAAWKARGLLDSASRALLIARLGPRYPSPATVGELVAAGERATQVAPRWAEAWFVAGENFALFGSLAGYTDAQQRADVAFRRAFALDSTDVQNLRSLLASRLRAKNRSDVRRFSTLYFKQEPNDDLAEFLRWSSAVVLGDSASVLEVRSRLSKLEFMDLQTIVMWSQANGIGLGDGARATEVLLRSARGGRERRMAVQTTLPFLLNGGRANDANRLLVTFEQGFGRNQAVGGVREFQILAALYWDGDSSAATGAAARLRSFLGGAAMQPGEVGDSATASCAMAHWYVSKGDLAAARDMLTLLQTLSRRRGLIPSIVSPVCAPLVETQLAARSGRRIPDHALARLDSILLATSNYRDQLVEIGNIVVARLYAQRGEVSHALAMVRRRTPFDFYLATQLREEGRLAASIGDRTGAIRAYQHYIALRSNAEPRLTTDVDNVRKELGGLLR